MGKGEPNPVDHWEKKRDKLDEYQLPLGRFETYNTWNFTTTRWVPNIFRMRRLKKKVQGPLQENVWKRAHDRIGELIYPSNLKRHVLMKFRNSSRKIITIYMIRMRDFVLITSMAITMLTIIYG